MKSPVTRAFRGGAYRDRTGDLRLAKLRRVVSVCRVGPLKRPVKPTKLWRDALIRHAAAPFGRAMLAERLQTFGGATTVLVVDDGLENRFGLLGPTRVQIPPPPLNSAKTAGCAGVLALSERVQHPSRITAMTG
jgi:hypothetical protein